MKQRRYGKRHILLFYRRTMDRLWKVTLVLGLLLAASWYWSYWLMPSLQPPYDTVVFVGASVILVFAICTFLARNMAYVQAFPDHLRLVTPFLRMKISYRRVHSIRPTDFQSQFPLKSESWAQHQFLEPFFGATLLIVELNKFPINPRTLRLFLPSEMFSRQTTGLVLMVKDWMALSGELDTFMGAWRQKQSQATPSGYGMVRRSSRRW